MTKAASAARCMRTAFHDGPCSHTLDAGAVIGSCPKRLSTTAPTFRAICLVCYTCYLTQPVSKRDAERAATSHLNAYRHNVSVQQVNQ